MGVTFYFAGDGTRETESETACMILTVVWSQTGHSETIVAQGRRGGRKGLVRGKGRACNTRRKLTEVGIGIGNDEEKVIVLADAWKDVFI